MRHGRARFSAETLVWLQGKKGGLWFQRLGHTVVGKTPPPHPVSAFESLGVEREARRGRCQKRHGVKPFSRCCWRNVGKVEGSGTIPASNTYIYIRHIT